MRNWMNLVEGLLPTLYHGSRQDFPIGTVLKPQEDDSYVLGSGMDPIEREAHDLTERKFEQYRPAHCVARHAAVFMVADPDEIDFAGGYVDHVYTCQPSMPVTRCNLAWYSEASMSAHTEQDWEMMAMNYWHGNTHNPDSDLFEFLAHSAVISSKE